MSPWERLLEQPHSREHFVQLYESDEPSLARNVCRYLGQGLKRGDGVLMIVTPEHRTLFCNELAGEGAAIEQLLADGQLVIRDAQATLSEFMVAGQPDWRLFEKAAGAAIRQVKARDQGSLRAYGEMVGVLWKARQFAAATRLEQLWNKLLEQASFSLYCAYAIDIFAKDFHPGNLDGVLCTHTHLVPSHPNSGLESALHAAMDEVLGAQAGNLRMRMKNNHPASWAVMGNAEASILWLRKNLPAHAEDIIERARLRYIEAA